MANRLDNFLSHLDKVRRTGKDSYLACCPAHDDKSPSLTVRELDDERILIHCFSGCDVESILSSIGLKFSDLYPEREIQHGKPERRPFPATDILRAIVFESLVVAACGRAMLSDTYTETDHLRLVDAVHRIQSAATAGGINHA